MSWKVQKTLRFHTRPQLAAQMLTTLRDEAVVSWTSVVAACLYGNSPEFLAVLDRDVDPVSMVATLSDTHAWLQGPMMETKQDRSGS